jgi:hypothetical protein
MSVRSALNRALSRKRLLFPDAHRAGTPLATLAAVSLCLLASACSDGDKPARLTPAAEAQENSLSRASGDTQNAPRAAALTIQTPSQEAAQATAQTGTAASDSLAPLVIHTVD